MRTEISGGAEEARASEGNARTEQLVLQLAEQSREMAEKDDRYRSRTPRGALRDNAPAEDRGEDPEVMSIVGEFGMNRDAPSFEP